MTFSYIWFLIGVGIAVYIAMGLKTAGMFFWCLGTSHGSSRPKWYLPMEIGYLIGMILVWPFFYLWLYTQSFISTREPKHIKDHKGPIYVHRYIPETQYACYGVAHSYHDENPLVIYQDIRTKKLYHCTETYFENNMKLISK